jgi:hypothetical protein
MRANAIGIFGAAIKDAATAEVITESRNVARRRL